MKKSIKEWEMKLRGSSFAELPQLLKELSSDERKGAKNLLKTFTKRVNDFEEERLRLEAMYTYEEACYKQGKRYIAGIDEVGRGPLAGPVVAAAVILPKGYRLHGINDSKKISEKKREALYHQIIKDAVDYRVFLVDPAEIDRINIYQAAKLAMTEAITELQTVPDHLLIDAMDIPIAIEQTKIIKGDEKSITIAAASIIAKVTRDNYMKKVDEQYPEYGFKNHMGYGTKEHLEALQKFGATKHHRISFNPVGEYIRTTGSD
jgi:ribonuclease HII